MAIEVLKPGLASTVQDAGRPGYYHLGIPQSGALDQASYLLGNWLVGNPEDAAVLECTLLAPELLFHDDAIVAVTGAHAEPRVDGQARPNDESFLVRPGERLSFGFMRVGARLYLALAGGIDVPLVLGSRSTYLLGGMGGLAGRKLQAGDVLPVGAASPAARAGRGVPTSLRPLPQRDAQLRVLPGLYAHRLQAASAEGFYADDWKVTAEADRVGYRFSGGAPLQFIAREPPFGAGHDPSNIVDAGYPYGSIQVPAGREPIVLHRDAVSGGGYAMIGTVISADMDAIAQLQPNGGARFVAVDMAQALDARAARRKRLHELRQALAS